MDRLCGGTFFVLLSNARRNLLSKADNYKGDSSGIAETDLLIALAKLSTPDLYDLKTRTLQNNTTSFKSCKNWGGSSFDLKKPGSISNLKKRFSEDYDGLVSEMSNIVEHFFDPKKDECLVKALIEVIKQDDKISPEQEFYIGNSVTKSTLSNIRETYLSAFLLGIWYYIITEIDDNRVGMDTFERWCPSQNQGKREYCKTIGEDSILVVNVKRDKEHFQSVSTMMSKAKTIELPAEIQDSVYKSPYIDSDELLLQEFTFDYDEIIQKCISESFADVWLDMKILHMIKELYETKWCEKANYFHDAMLKSNVYATLGKLNEMCNALDSENYTPCKPVRVIRTSLRNLYVKLHPDNYVGIFPYDVFIDDWNEGEEY